MVPQDFGQLSRQRSQRARELAHRFDWAREVLEFYSRLANLQGRMALEIQANGCDSPAAHWKSLRGLVMEHGPELLRMAADRMDPSSVDALVSDYLNGQTTGDNDTFFARTLAQVACRDKPPAPFKPSLSHCPRCGFPPQVGVLETMGHGQSLSLICSLCNQRWTFPRGRCPACDAVDDKQLAYFQSELIPHVTVQACERCRVYLHLVDVSKEPAAIPEVDELCAMPLDIWARQHGYHKLHPNLAGI